MPELLPGEDPEPSDRLPAGPLFVPVRPGPGGCVARLFRTPLGERTTVGFTSRRALAETLGPDQKWIRLAEPALRALTAPLGVTTLTVDPQLCAPAPARTGARSPAGAPAKSVAPPLQEAAALVSALALLIAGEGITR
ncbi:SAV_915 family protein [Streptomyces sp. NPDC056948]|uniref:SAV_915 family protein n=1 Tax=Streptomyces sp. NPDC056948 TaxID=3345975 RepID=UPI00363C1C87